MKNLKKTPLLYEMQVYLLNLIEITLNNMTVTDFFLTAFIGFRFQCLLILAWEHICFGDVGR